MEMGFAIVIIGVIMIGACVFFGAPIVSVFANWWMQ
jgi:hypothetical protein